MLETVLTSVSVRSSLISPGSQARNHNPLRVTFSVWKSFSWNLVFHGFYDHVTLNLQRLYAQILSKKKLFDPLPLRIQDSNGTVNFPKSVFKEGGKKKNGRSKKGREVNEAAVSAGAAGKSTSTPNYGAYKRSQARRLRAKSTAFSLPTPVSFAMFSYIHTLYNSHHHTHVFYSPSRRLYPPACTLFQPYILYFSCYFPRRH